MLVIWRKCNELFRKELFGDTVGGGGDRAVLQLTWQLPKLGSDAHLAYSMRSVCRMAEGWGASTMNPSREASAQRGAISWTLTFF